VITLRALQPGLAASPASFRLNGRAIAAPVANCGYLADVRMRILSQSELPA